jgi:c-di-GMP-binding flagellar brake protein YcgR
MATISSPFSLNQRLEIAPQDALEYLPSRIEDFSGDNMVVAMPMRNALPLYLPIGTAVFGRAIAEEGILYSFESVLLEMTMYPLPLWTIRKPENVNRIQQRNFFRYPAHLTIRYFLVNETTGKPLIETETVGMSHNLSGGGVLLIANSAALKLGTRVWVEIPLTPTATIRSVAVAVRMDVKKDEYGKTVFLIALQFVNMDEFMRHKIIKFLNARLLEERNRGVL